MSPPDNNQDSSEMLALPSSEQVESSDTDNQPTGDLRMLAARHGITHGNRIVDRGCHRGMWYTAYAGSNGFCNGSFLFGDTVLGVQDRTSRAIRLRGL